jgi:hypothetical protein
MKPRFLLLTLFTLPFFSFAQLNPVLNPPNKDGKKKDDHSHQQVPPPEKINWNKTRKLSWKDYKGKWDEKKSFTCYSFITTSFNYYESFKHDSLIVEMEATFYPTDSYAKEDTKTKARLEHEQGVFDLYEIWARHFKKSIVTSKFSKHSYSVYLKNMYKANLQNRNAEIAKYRNETKSGSDPVKQKEWSEKIKKDLLALDAYKANVVRVLIQ